MSVTLRQATLLAAKVTLYADVAGIAWQGEGTSVKILQALELIVLARLQSTLLYR